MIEAGQSSGLSMYTFTSCQRFIYCNIVVCLPLSENLKLLNQKNQNLFNFLFKYCM